MSLISSATALAVGTVYYVWRAYQDVRLRRERLLRQRVAFMLWVMAEQENEQPAAYVWEGG